MQPAINPPDHGDARCEHCATNVEDYTRATQAPCDTHLRNGRFVCAACCWCAECEYAVALDAARTRQRENAEMCDACHTPSVVLTAIRGLDGITELRCEPCIERLVEDMRDLGLSA